MKARSNTFLTRIYFILAVFIALSLGIIFRVFQISVVQQDRWVEKGENLFVKRIPIKAERGDILADDGSLLATELQFFDIFMDFRATGITDEAWNRDVDSLAILLSKHLELGKDYTEMKNWLNQKRLAKSNNRYVRLAQDISYEKMKLLQTFPILRRGQNKGGLIVKREAKRQKPFGMLASRTIGLSRLNADAVGLELSFDKELRGMEGSQVMHKTMNAYLPIDNVTAIQPERGQDLQTSINVNIQDISESALHKALVHHDANYGVALVMDVETGQIKAIANLGITKSKEYAEMYNYAIGTATMPGSTMKLASLLVMLEDGYLKEDELVNLNRGELKLCGETLHDAEPHNLTMVTARTAFEKSSNVGMAELVRRYYRGKDKKFIEGLNKLRLNQKVGVEIVGEATPHIKHPDKDQDWSCTSLPWTSIGYEMTITPLQMLTLYNAVANGGKMMKPYLVTEIVEFDKKIKEFKPTVLDYNIAKPSTIKKAQSFLEGVVLRGTASRLRSDKYNFAAKTGTSIIGKSKGRKIYQATMAGYFPAKNPRYSCLVLVSDPKRNGYYGSRAAGSVFAEIVEKVFSSDPEMHRTINGDEEKYAEWKEEKRTENTKWAKGKTEDINFLMDEMDFTLEQEIGSEWTSIKSVRDTALMNALDIEKGTVPDVRGLALKDAIFILENRGLKVRFTGMGKVVTQSIRPGTKVNEQNIRLSLG